MNEEFKRKLAAILSADVVCYSFLINEDEESTIRTLKLSKIFKMALNMAKKETIHG